MVNVPYPDMSVQVALNANPNSNDNPRWTDISELVQQAEGINRGHPYQQPTGQASTPRVVIRDPQELFNVANTVDSPFVNGLGGRNVQPYRAICWQCMHPRGTTGNLLNLSNWRVPIDPGFESYTAGATPSWVSWFGPNQPTIDGVTTPFQGTKSLKWNITNGSGLQGPLINFPCIPGRYYLISVYVNQTQNNTMTLFINGHTDLATTTVINSWTRLSGVFYADQPQLQFVVGSRNPTQNSTQWVDAIQIEPVLPVNPTGINFNGQNGGTGSLGGFVVLNNLVATVSKAPGVGGFHLASVRLHPDGVTANPKFQCPFFTVSPNTAYAVHGIIYAPSVTRNITVWWYDNTHTFISANSIVIAGVAADWNLLDALQVTSPANAAFAQVGTESSAATGTDWWIDSVALLPATPAAFTTTGPVIYPVLRDWVERWPRRHDSMGFEGIADLQLVDGFAALASVRLPTDFAAAVRATNPLYYWRLNEPFGATTFAESSGNNGPPLTRFDDPSNGPADNFAAGVSLGLLGDPGQTGLAIGELVPAVQHNSSNVQAGGPNANKPQITISAVPWAYTEMIWINHGSLGSVFNNWFVLTTKQNANPFMRFAWAWGNQPALEFFGCFDPTGNTLFGPVNFPITDKWNDGAWHMYIVTVSAPVGPNTFTTLYVDNVQITQTIDAVNSSFVLPVTLDWVQVGAQQGYAGAMSTPLVGGQYAHRAFWNRALTPQEMTTLYQTAKGAPAGPSGELPGARITRHLSGRYLTGTNIVPPSRISTGRSVLGPSSSGERASALTDAQAITVAEAGALWIGPDGALVFEARDDRFKRLTPTLTFGEDFANGECPYQPGYLYDFDPMFIYGDVQVTQTQGVIATGGRTADINAANAQFFGRSFTAQVDLLTSLQTQDYADWTFYTHNTPTQRIEAVTIDPMSNPALWPFVLNVEIGQRVRVRRRPRGLAGNLVYDQQYFVEQVLHSQINLDVSNDRPLSWRTSITLTPTGVANQPWILDDPTWSVLGNTTRLGF